MADNVYQDSLRSFIVFNDGDLSLEPVTDGDLVEVSVHNNAAMKNSAWSCAVDWFFVVLDSGILLMSVHSDNAILCRKKSAMFIEMFMEAPKGKKRKGGRHGD